MNLRRWIDGRGVMGLACGSGRFVEEGYIERSGHGSTMDLVLVAGVDEDDGAVLDVLLHGPGIELGQAVAVSEDRRSVTVLPLHPPEVGGSDGLYGQELVVGGPFVGVVAVVDRPGEV